MTDSTTGVLAIERKEKSGRYYRLALALGIALMYFTAYFAKF
jgi:hypothetical protein